MLPRVFLSPAKWRVTSGDALFFLSRMVRMRRNRFATLILCDAPRVCHIKVVKFSLQNPACIHLVGTSPSNTSHPRTTAAILRSEFVMLPVEFAKVEILRRTSSVQIILHRIGTKAFVPGIHTTLYPSLDASSVAL